MQTELKQPAKRGRRPWWQPAAAALIALIGLAGSVAANAAPASAAGWASGKLTLRTLNAYSVEATIIGSFEMSAEEARVVLASDPLITVTFKGADAKFDDTLATYKIRPNGGLLPTYLSTTDQGLGLYSRWILATFLLNEDLEGRDEVYVHIRLSTGTRTIARFNTFPVHGYY